MGQLAIQTHWDRVVVRSNRCFYDAERWLVDASAGSNSGDVQDAAYEALRTGMVAATFLYHFAEVALERRAVNPQPANVPAIRALIEYAARTGAGDLRPNDHRILGGLANAVKHAELRDPNIVEVPHTGVVIRITHSNPVVYNEGRPDGTPQVVVVTQWGDRSLKALLENVCFGWHHLLGL